MRTWIRGLLPAVALVGLSGCGASGPGTSPPTECGPSMRFHGVVYVSDGRVNDAQSLGRDVGSGAALDCDRRTVLDRVVVSVLTEVGDRQAIGVRRGRWQGVYVAEDVPHSRLPQVLFAR